MHHALHLSLGLLLSALLVLAPRPADAQEGDAGARPQPSAAGVTVPLVRPTPGAQRGMVADSIVYDDGNPTPDDYIGFGAATPFFAATRFTASSAFTLTGTRIAYRTEFSSLNFSIEVYDAAAGPMNPTGGTLLFSGTTNVLSINGQLGGFNFGAPVGPFAAGESFFIVVTFIDVGFPMGADTRGSGDYAGRCLFSGSGANGDWTVLADILGGGQADAWVIRALGDGGGGGGQVPDINVTPPSLAATLGAGASTALNLSIGNTGAGVLTWSAAAAANRVAPASPEPPVAVPYASLPAASDFAALRAAVQQRGTVPVIVGLNTAFRPEGELGRTDAVDRQRQRIADEREAVLARLAAYDVQHVKHYETVPYVAMTVGAAALDALAADPSVYDVHEDEAVPATLAESTAIVGAPNAWQQGFAGSGHAVAVLDTGVDTGHPFFGGRTVAEGCFSSAIPGFAQSNCPNGQTQQTGPGAAAPCSASVPGCDHGTHVAGIAVGRGASFSGVGREANLIAVQVFSTITDAQACGGQAPCTTTFFSDVMRGLEYVYNQRGTFAIASANMSLGGGRVTGTCDDNPLKPIIDNLRGAGIASVIATGNDGFSDAVGEPACISTAVAVGSTNDGSGGQPPDAVSSFSNSAAGLDLLAPGFLITSSVPGGGFGDKAGTSMAAPHIAGAWAVLKGQRPQASVTEILGAIASTGVPVTDPRNGLTRPRLQLDAALGGGGGGSWLSVSPSSGTTAGGASSAVTVGLDASGLSAGTYAGTIIITSNDPDEASVVVPVTLTVEGGGGGGSLLTHLRPGDTQNTFTVQDGGYVHGTNSFGDLGKAVAFEVPGGAGELAAVDLYIGARAPTPVLASYTLKIYGGTPASGPQGSPLFSQAYALADAQVDGDPNTPSPPTRHVFGAPVAVGSAFFVSVEFAAPYGAEDVSMAATGLLGAPSPFEWELWSDNSWNNMSTAWTQGADGWHMWVEAHMGSVVATEGDAAPAETVLARPELPQPIRLVHGDSVRAAPRSRGEAGGLRHARPPRGRARRRAAGGRDARGEVGRRRPRQRGVRRPPDRHRRGPGPPRDAAPLSQERYLLQSDPPGPSRPGESDAVTTAA